MKVTVEYYLRYASGQKSHLFDNKECYTKMVAVQFGNIIYHLLIQIVEIHLIVPALAVCYLSTLHLKNFHLSDHANAPMHLNYANAFFKFVPF